MNRAPIGIFDSGFGGLSIYRSIADLLPHESTIYIGDHKYLPYGAKTKPQIQKRAKKLITFLLSRRVKLIVVACNTATIAGIDLYRTWFPDIPIIGVVPVVKTAGEISRKNSFAVLSTAFTARSAYQRNLIRTFAPHSQVFNLGCPNLLSFVERAKLNGGAIDSELRSLLTPEVVSSIDVVVLGCTHYPFLIRSIRAIVGDDIRILDSGGAVARHVRRILLHNRIQTDNSRARHWFFSTGRSAGYSDTASALLGRKLNIRYADV